MRIDTSVISFEWDHWNKFKNLEKHGVTNDEAEEAFSDPRARIRGTSEGRYFHFGKSSSGRYLFQVFIIPHKNVVRIISSRLMTDREKQYYGKK